MDLWGLEVDRASISETAMSLISGVVGFDPVEVRCSHSNIECHFSRFASPRFTVRQNDSMRALQ